jgi:hypothetical protein
MYCEPAEAIGTDSYAKDTRRKQREHQATVTGSNSARRNIHLRACTPAAGTRTYAADVTAATLTTTATLAASRRSGCADLFAAGCTVIDTDIYSG